MTLLNVCASIVLIVLAVVLLSKPFTRTIWFLFPYSGLSSQLRAVTTAHYIARRFRVDDEIGVYQNRFGRACVDIPHELHHGFVDEEIGGYTSILFEHLADNLAPQLGFKKGAVHVLEDHTVFQFWD